MIIQRFLVVGDDRHALCARRVPEKKAIRYHTGFLDGQEALDLFTTNSPGLVLLDLMIPRIAGWKYWKKSKP
jgi:DNA-binding response OmpR family regulator